MISAHSSHDVSAKLEALFDPDYYRRRYPLACSPGVDPFVHFMTSGWRELRRPHAEFDVGWYIAAHLDPASDAVNPLVHYVEQGRSAGLATRPRVEVPRESMTLPAVVRRAVLFAGYDADCLVDETVVAYITELSRHADVFYLSDNDMSPGELSKLDGIVVGAWAIRHRAYDFGSYAMLANQLVGWERLASYDEVLLVNDSCYLTGPLNEVFAAMSARPCAWWGLQATEELASPAYGETVVREASPEFRRGPIAALVEPLRDTPVPALARDMFERFPDNEFHVGSYFIALRRPVLMDVTFRRFLASATAVPERPKGDVIRRYEYGLTRLLVSLGHGFDTFIGELYPFQPVFNEWAFDLMEAGLPLIKRGLLAGNPFGIDLRRWQEQVLVRSRHADVSAMERHLRRTTEPVSLQRAWTRCSGSPAAGHATGKVSA